MKYSLKKVHECADINPSSINPVKLPYEYINYYDISSVGSGFLGDVSMIKVDKAPSRARRVVECGDTIVSMVRPGNKTYYYFNECTNQDIVSTGFAVLHPRESIIDSKYLYYAIINQDFISYLVQNEKGATYPAVDERIIANGMIRVYDDLDIQKRIGDALFVYDDLIKNYQKQIKLLEEAAQRLYKEWFIDFHFPGYKNVNIVNGVPNRWEKKPLNVIIGKIPHTKQIKATEYLHKGNIPVIDQSRDFIAGYTNDEKSLVNLDVPVIVFGDHTRILKYIQFPFARGADGTQLIISNMINMPQSLLYLSLIAVDLSNYHYARHFKYLKAESILVPTQNIAREFDSIVSPLMLQIQLLRNKCNKLSQARDLLLPKLMNGEFDI